MEQQRMVTVDCLADICELARRLDVYVRVSRGPDEDPPEGSKDYESGCRMPGVSVNPIAPPAWWCCTPQDWVARQLCQYLHLREEADDDRRVWLLTGREVGRGPDNEPLLGDVRPLAWVSDDCIGEARRRYEERMDAGRDSTRSPAGGRARPRGETAGPLT
jgi:hypothetical protein